MSAAPKEKYLKGCSAKIETIWKRINSIWILYLIFQIVINTWGDWQPTQLPHKKIFFLVKQNERKNF